MNDHETNFEQNLARLLPSSCGPETAPSPATREQLRRKLMAAQCPQRQSDEFPASVLGILTFLIFVMLATWIVCAAAGAGSMAGRLASHSIFAIVIVNVLGAPVAGLAIVLRRKYA
jgi:hypothetical protein